MLALEAQFFHTLNRFAEPPIRAGFGSPCVLLPNGLIVLETVGRRTGRLYRTPVVATLFGGRLFVSTVRGKSSQWLKNLAAAPQTRYWSGGKLNDGDALVFAPDDAAPNYETLPPALRPFVAGMNRLGAGLAVITPRAGEASS